MSHVPSSTKAGFGDFSESFRDSSSTGHQDAEYQNGKCPSHLYLLDLMHLQSPNSNALLLAGVPSNNYSPLEPSGKEVLPQYQSAAEKETSTRYQDTRPYDRPRESRTVCDILLIILVVLMDLCVQVAVYFAVLFVVVLVGSSLGIPFMPHLDCGVLKSRRQ